MCDATQTNGVVGTGDLTPVILSGSEGSLNVNDRSALIGSRAQRPSSTTLI
jgi:hypothetical protein